MQRQQVRRMAEFSGAQDEHALAAAELGRALKPTQIKPQRAADTQAAKIHRQEPILRYVAAGYVGRRTGFEGGVGLEMQSSPQQRMKPRRAKQFIGDGAATLSAEPIGDADKMNCF